MLDEVAKAPEKISESLEKFRFREALGEMMNLARIGNKYLAEQEPWKLIKTDENRVKTIMNVSLQIAANLAIVCEPFLPFTSKRLFNLLNLSPLKWNSSRNTNNIASGHKISSENAILFSKIEDAEIALQIEKLQRSRESNSTGKLNPPIKTETTFDDFNKMDIRVATITAAEVVPKTDKLLKLTLDTGLDIRTVVSGIAIYYKPENIIGQKVIMLANLAPRKIKGIESQGMILMAEDSKGELSFVSPTKKESENGSIVK